MIEGHKTTTKAMADRYIPRRGDSVDGDARAFLQMESSCTQSAADRELTHLSMLNLSMGPEERAERKEEHKNNVVAAMMDRKAIRSQNKFTALAAGNQHTGHGNALPMRNLKLTNPERA